MIPIELKSFSDETISSWLIRNSIANGSDPSSWVAGVWLNWRTWTRDIDRYLPKQKVYELSKITSLSIEDIKNMTLESIVCNLENNKKLNPKSKWKWVVPTGSRSGVKTNGMHFCPECLSEPTPYLKKEWRLSWNVVCPIHNCLLVIHCESCNSSFSPYLVDYVNINFTLCTHCGFDLKKSKKILADEDIRDVQIMLNKLVMDDGTAKYPFDLRSYDYREFFLTFRTFILFFRRLNHFKNHQKDIFERMKFVHDELPYTCSHGGYFDSLNVRERYSALRQTIKLLQHPFDTVIDILKDSNISQQMLHGEVVQHTRFINDVLSKLENKSRKYTKRQSVHHTIAPKSINEIQSKMKELKCFM